jgi:polar amino acid transport system substrate-binding protein
MQKLLAVIGIPALIVVALAGCGSSSSTGSSSSATSSTATTSSANASIAAEVPAAIKSKGTLTIASDATYAPNEFVGPDGHTVVGMDVDLMNAIGAQMGLKVKFVNATFDTIIPGLAAGKYDLGVSSFTDTKEREKTVEFVDYFSAGISFYAKTSANPAVSTVADLCGKSVAVEKGTVEQEESEAQSKKCTKAGKPAVKVLSFPDQNGANLAVSSGRAELGMADSPVAEYQVKQSSGAFKLIGQPYEVAPYGIAVPKTSGLSKPILAALKAIMANGEYTKILTKWGLQSGAISSPKIDGATS